MKRIFSYVMFGLAAAALPLLGGCPIYSDDGGQRVCLDNGQCYTCPSGNYGTDCSGYACNSDNDCPNGYSCNGSGGCVPSAQDASAGGSTCSQPSDCLGGATCGSDSQCHTGDCSTVGCPNNFVCKLSDGALLCVGTGTTADSGPGTSDANSGDGGTDGDAQIGPPVACHNDTECTPAGDKCLDGKCVAPADQCYDTTQCPNSEQCVAGVCTPSCATTACPTGYACDANKVCSGNPTPCGAAADASTCGAGTTCVEERCVPACSPTLTCNGALVCVDGGCIPDQQPQFACATEGVMDSCATGSICLHHSCYIACNNGDAGVSDGGANGCKSADEFNVCKQVVTSTGSYSVCGSATNLGTDCDPTQGKNCTSGKVCIDGFCK